jgi:deoxyribonuclease-4
MAARRKVCPIGAHVPVGGGLARRGLSYADTVGAETVQVFVSNPRGWAPAAGKPAEDEAFRAGCADRGITAFIHSPYLINFGSPTPETLRKSVAATAHSLLRGADIGATGVVVHAGSAVAGAHRDDALKQLREHVLPLLDDLPEGAPRLLIEPTAGGGQALAARVEQLEEYFDALDRHPRLGVCLDTCHVFAAGHDLTETGGVRRLMTALTKAVGQGRLGLVHANDSKDPAGSTRDRHTTIGSGCIGTEPFAQLLNHPTVRGVPVLVETPEEGAADDIATLKALRPV